MMAIQSRRPLRRHPHERARQLLVDLCAPPPLSQDTPYPSQPRRVAKRIKYTYTVEQPALPMECRFNVNKVYLAQN